MSRFISGLLSLVAMIAPLVSSLGILANAGSGLVAGSAEAPHLTCRSLLQFSDVSSFDYRKRGCAGKDKQDLEEPPPNPSSHAKPKEK